MSEKQIRDILRDVCADLDRHSRYVVHQGVRKLVLPTVIGASLALSGCDSRNVPEYAAPAPDAQVTEAGADQGGGALYMAPDGMVYMAPDSGAQPPYMAPPFDTGAIPPYMAPDKGGQPEYMAPGPDGGPQPDYQAPEI